MQAAEAMGTRLRLRAEFGGGWAKFAISQMSCFESATPTKHKHNSAATTAASTAAAASSESHIQNQNQAQDHFQHQALPPLQSPSLQRPLSQPQKGRGSQKEREKRELREFHFRPAERASLLSALLSAPFEDGGAGLDLGECYRSTSLLRTFLLHDEGARARLEKRLGGGAALGIHHVKTLQGC
mmetsp:Transcript_19208/g.44856  ORF Transcript_19208/g.44856 Transcript_19208/m.44856 type:complete len:184 (+) Transcript_19208:424-975(+)